MPFRSLLQVSLTYMLGLFYIHTRRNRLPRVSRRPIVVGYDAHYAPSPLRQACRPALGIYEKETQYVIKRDLVDRFSTQVCRPALGIYVKETQYVIKRDLVHSATSQVCRRAFGHWVSFNCRLGASGDNVVFIGTRFSLYTAVNMPSLLMTYQVSFTCILGNQTNSQKSSIW